LVVVGGVVKFPGEVNTCILLNPPAGITPGAICGAVMVPVSLVFATESICALVINPAIFVFATKPEMFAEAAKPPKFLLTAIVILRYFILRYLLMVEVVEQVSLK
jgi:hypothetical protein